FTLHSQVRSIRVYNIESGETYDISLDVPAWGEVWHVTGQVINNTYYFGVGGPYGASLQYKLDLPPQRNSHIMKLKEPLGGNIEHIGNIYLSSSCYEGCTYSLFHPGFFTITPLKRMTEISNNQGFGKEEFVGIDSKGRMIVDVRN